LDDMLGSIGQVEAKGDDPREVWASLRGERWHAVSEVPLKPGERVRVVGRAGLVLKVIPVPDDLKGE
ncbi:hypothetical protein E4K72_16885, partial [Oxalobacteraceae bacterium OM1]